MAERPILFSAPMVRAILNGTKTQTRRVVKFDSEIAGLSDVVQWARALVGNECYGRAITEDDIKSKAAQLAGRIHPVILDSGSMVSLRCPYGQPGDRLWVRESFQPLLAEGVDHWHADWKTGKGYAVSYPATDGVQEYIDVDDNLRSSSKPSIHMPRWASRITLEVTGVRVEKLQDISEADAIAEGAPGYEEGIDSPPPEHGCEWSYRASFRRLWESINGRPKLPPNPASLRYARVKRWLEKRPDTTSWDANPWVWVVSFKRVEVSNG